MSFADAKRREASVLDYVEGDEFKLADFMERLRFVRGELHFDADYIRGRRIKTRIIVVAHNTWTDPQYQSDSLLLLYGAEWTTDVVSNAAAGAPGSGRATQCGAPQRR